MSEPFRSEALALPFFIADAWLERLSDALNDYRLSAAYVGAKRHSLSTGSSRVDILYRKKRIGWFVLTAFSEQTTLFEAYTTDQQKAQVIIPTLAERLYDALHALAARVIKHETLIGPQFAELRNRILATANALSHEPHEPKPSDSIDTWLDWRDGELARTGRRISLTRIAEMSGHKHNTLKKKSAARLQKDDDTPNAP
jgi:hypothetical protein